MKCDMARRIMSVLHLWVQAVIIPSSCSAMECVYYLTILCHILTLPCRFLVATEDLAPLFMTLFIITIPSLIQRDGRSSMPIPDSPAM
jgi:hypothetical protein